MKENTTDTNHQINLPSVDHTNDSPDMKEKATLTIDELIKTMPGYVMIDDTPHAFIMKYIKGELPNHMDLWYVGYGTLYHTWSSQPDLHTAIIHCKKRLEKYNIWNACLDM